MGVPIEYITKRVQFLDFTLHINPGVFIPRFETEYFIELIIRQLSYKPSRILDIGTGCGAIVVALAKKYPEAHLFATDRSQYAIENARKNVNELNLNSRVFLLGADLFTPLKSKFDLIVCNPPYIPYERLKSLPESVKGFEPFLSLNGGKDGIQFIKRLISSGMNSLTTNGSMAIEIDEDEVEKLKNFLIINNIKNFAFEKDQFDRFRYLLIGNFNQ
jgi:release factor glutamine methyltransferase